MFALKRYSQGTWYPWLANGVRFKVRPLSNKKILELRSESKRGKVAVEMPTEDPANPGNHLVKIVDDYNDYQYEWKMFCHCLEDWEGITIEGDLEVSKEEIRDGIFNNSEMRMFILQKSLELVESENKKVEEELKNSLSSQGG